MITIITVRMDSAAFDDAPASELSRILRQLAADIEQDGPEFASLADRNGHVVGSFRIAQGASP